MCHLYHIDDEDVLASPDPTSYDQAMINAFSACPLHGSSMQPAIICVIRCLMMALFLWSISCGRGMATDRMDAEPTVQVTIPDDDERTITLGLLIPGLHHLVIDHDAPTPLIVAVVSEDSDPVTQRPLLVLPQGIRQEPIEAENHPTAGRWTYELHHHPDPPWRISLQVYRLRRTLGLILDGDSSAVAIPYTFGIFDGTKPLTIECWLRLRRLPIDHDWQRAPVAIHLMGEAVLRLGLADGCSSPDRIGIRGRFADAGWHTPAESEPLTVATWYHIAVTYDPHSGWTMYQDGQAVSSSTLTEGITTSNADSFIGADPNPRVQRHFDGALRDVRFWNTARTAEDIRSTMQTRLDGDEAGLVAYWPLDHESGPEAQDLAAGRRHGRLMGNARWGVTDIAVHTLDDTPSLTGLRQILPALCDDGRKVALIRIADMGGDSAETVLSRYVIDDPSTQVRLTAGRGLARLGLTASIPTLITAMDDPDAEIRATAVTALRTHSAQAHPALIKAITGNRNDAGRLLIIEEVQRQQIREAVPMLCRVVQQDHSSTLRIAALTALGSILAGQPDEEALTSMQAALAADEPTLRSTALLALAQMGGDEATRMLLASPQADWPMWGYDPQHSGISPMAFLLDRSVHLQWRRRMPLPRRAWGPQPDDADKLEFDRSYAPVAADGRIFVTCMTTDSLSAYDLDSGALLWRFHADGPMRLAPAVWRDRVIAISDDGHCYALNTTDGRLLWRHAGRPTAHRVLGNERIISMWPARGAPVVADGTVYYAAGIWPFLGTFLFALDAEDGREIWANTGHAFAWNRQPHGGAYAFAGLAPQGYIAVANDRLVVSGGRALPALFDRQDGRLLHYQGDGSSRGVKRVGGYRVRIHEGHYYNHGRSYVLQTGALDGLADLEHRAITTLDKAISTITDQLDAAPATALVAGDRLVVVSETGTLHVFGPQAVNTIEHPVLAYSPVLQDDTIGRLADVILAHAQSGYGLMLGLDDGRLLEALALRSEMHLVGIDADQNRIQALRHRYHEAGLYGADIALFCDDPLTAHYPAHISNLIVIPDASIFGVTLTDLLQEAVYQRLRPYTGTAVILGATATQRQALLAFEADNGQVLETPDGPILIQRTGPLPDSGRWTHQHADAAQTGMSQDARARPPLAPTWFGGPTNEHVLPRHTTGPRPQVAGGRVVLLGVETLSARCVFTGRELWRREFPGIGHPFTNRELEERWRRGEEVYMTNMPGATYIGSPLVTLPDAVYLRHQGQVLRLDPDSGETRATFTLPARTATGASDWGHLSVVGEVLLTTSDPHIFDAGRIGQDPANWDGTSSERLIALDRHDGRMLWHRDAAVGFRHNAIAGSGDRVFVIDALSEQARQHDARRGRTSTPARIMALDLPSGTERWSTDSEVFGTFLSYSQEHDVLVEGGSSDGRRHLPDEPTDRLIARRGSDGSILWQHNDGGRGPRILHGDEIIPSITRSGDSATVSLLTGDPYLRRNPLHDEQEAWSYWRSYGCGASNASTHLLLFRSGAAGFTDLRGDGGTGNFGGFKSGCTSNMIAADGLLIAPDYTRTCTCSYQNQTSIAMIHMPEMEMWTANHARREPPERLRRAGINLGAPGDRRADDGILWNHFPRRAPSVEHDVVTTPDDPATFHRFSLFLHQGDGIPWVAASGLRDLRSLTLRGVNGGEARYRITLHFSEPDGLEAGQRRYDIRINGQMLHRDFDIVSAAGGPHRPTTLVFDDIAIATDLHIELLPSEDSIHLPLLSGVAIEARSLSEE